MKRLASIAIICFLMMTPPISAFAVLQGDIDNSGNVDLKDAIMALQLFSGIDVTNPIYISADVNGDNKIGMAEVIYALQCTALVRRDCLKGCGCPEVVLESTVPANASRDVPVDASITATFNKTMNASTVTEDNFYVKFRNQTGFMSGTVAYDKLTAIFTPFDLPYNETLTATITTAVKDMAGNALPSNYSWTFTTREPPQASVDESFGLNGKTTTHFEGETAGITAIAIRPNGKIVAAGSALRYTSLHDFSLVSYNSDGTARR
jgi:hypothetical protein